MHPRLLWVTDRRRWTLFCKRSNGLGMGNTDMAFRTTQMPANALLLLYKSCAAPDTRKPRYCKKRMPLSFVYAALSPPLRTEVLSVMRIIVSGQRGDLIRFGYASAASRRRL
jgi:hypothetical protein